jgi:hypothetical protein
MSLAIRTDPTIVIAARHSRRNASHRVLEKLGFTRSGQFNIQRTPVLEWQRVPNVTPNNQLQRP